MLLKTSRFDDVLRTSVKVGLLGPFSSCDNEQNLIFIFFNSPVQVRNDGLKTNV